MAAAQGLVIRNGTVVNADQEFVADVYCVDGVIEAVGAGLEVPAGTEEVDATGLLVMPGGVDPHTHMQLPFMGTVAIDDFDKGTRAALCGGTTTIIDFVIPSPGQSLLAAFDQWMEWAEQSHLDYGFHVAVTWWSDQVSEEMGVLSRERHVQSYKHFAAYKGAIMLDTEAMVQSFARAKELGALCTVHAEDGELVYRGQQEMLEQGITGPEGHPWSRPVEVEALATNNVARIAQVLNVPVYIVHVSCELAMDVIARARREGQKIYGEALAGHLTIDDSCYLNEDWERAAMYVMSPPFRPDGNPQALWRGLQAGTLQTTATDNCCFCLEQKAMGRDDFSKIPNGTNGVEDRMSVLFHHGVTTGKLSRCEYVAATSTEAAKIFNLYPRKGVIAVGSDADMVIMDPNAKRTISAETHHQAIDTNIWEGWEVQGVPAVTIRAGKVVWRAVINDGVADWAAGEYTGKAGDGRYLERPCFGHTYQGIAERDAINKKVPVQRQ